MYLRRCYREKDGKRHAYWALVRSVRTGRGPRQEVVAYLGEMDEQGRVGVKRAAEAADGEGRGGGSGRGASDGQGDLFPGPAGSPPQWVQVDVGRVRVENARAFGGPWLGAQVANRLGLGAELGRLMPPGREDVPWAATAELLVVGRLCDPSSELHLAEHYAPGSALCELLGVPGDKVNDDRLYRALDELLPHKRELEASLKGRLGELFGLAYDLLLYDVTSTYFEGGCGLNDQAARGYSRDSRGDCKQVCIALVVSRCGMPVGYELFPGNKADVTTVQEVVGEMESRYGKADRIWVMDRGMVSEENVKFLAEGGRRYIVGTPRTMLKRYEKELLGKGWDAVRDGLEVKLCPKPDANEGGGSKESKESKEVFILCRSADRREKEKAMHGRFEKRIEDGLKQLKAGSEKRPCTVAALAQRVGKLLGRNTRAAGLFRTEVKADEKGHAVLSWEKVESWRSWAALSEGCYLLRSNVTDWTAADLWRAYTQLTEAEGAFRVQKGDLCLRPVWHRKKGRVQAHVLVCFLGYVLWKTLGQMCRAAGLGDEPRKVLEEISRIQVVDVVLPTREGIEIRKRCVSRPTEHQAILLAKLGLRLPKSLGCVDV